MKNFVSVKRYLLPFTSFDKDNKYVNCVYVNGFTGKITILTYICILKVCTFTCECMYCAQFVYLFLNIKI